MAHLEQVEFCRKVRELFPDFFRDKLVLDIGSLDINGNNQYLFENCKYLGVDVADGDNVDLICLGGKVQLPDESIDVIISTECFEHDMYYTDTLLNSYRMLRPGGLLLFTCATEGRPEHGTSNTTPGDAPLLQENSEWKDYYKNLTESDIRNVWDIEKLFKSAVFEVNNKSHDLYFYGFKTGEYCQRKNRYNSEQMFEMALLRELIADKDRLLANSQEVLSNKDAAMIKMSELLQERDSVIHGIMNSKSWRYTKIGRVLFAKMKFWKLGKLVVE